MTFVKGQSGNPNGRPKRGTALSDELRAFLDKKTGKPPSSNAEQLVKAVYRAAKDGDMTAAKLIWDRIEGGVPHPVEVTGADGGPLALRVEGPAAPMIEGPSE